MHKLYELKSMLCDELEKYGAKDRIDVTSLEAVDKLAHAIKNINKIIETEGEEEYSGREYGGNGRSYARRRDSMSRYSRTEYGREPYSRDGYSMAADDVVDELREIMQSAKDERTKAELKQTIRRIEQM